MPPRPFWIAQALATEDGSAADALRGPTRAALAIVGGGFTGLWTAIRAKQQQPALDVVLIESDLCGAGASGRNGGLALSWSTKYFTLQRLFGAAEAARLVRASEQAILDIEAFCFDHRFDCEWRRLGSLFTASSTDQLGA
ncbi:MAG: FAD-dependent oxidoreductase, partial [Rhodoferax sp.]